MLQLGDGITCFSTVFLAALLLTRNAVFSASLTAFLYFLILACRYPQIHSSRARQVIRPSSTIKTGGVSVVAHRGGGHDAPENTLAAIREASRNGATGVELDLEFTSDGVPVLMHDETVDRTTDGSGALSEIRFSDLSKLDASAKHRLRQDSKNKLELQKAVVQAWQKMPSICENAQHLALQYPRKMMECAGDLMRYLGDPREQFRGEKVPTLREAVEECLRLQLTIYFDVKGHAEEAAAVLKDLYQKHPVLYNTSIVCSFHAKVIYRMRQADPQVVTALTHRPWSLSRLGDGRPRFSAQWKHNWMQVMDVLLDWAHHHLFWHLLGVSAFLVQKNYISQDYVQFWTDRGVEVVSWTINTEVEKQYHQQLLNISYITDSLREDCGPHY